MTSESPEVGNCIKPLLSVSKVKRVLKPGGLYIFIEHVAAKDGSLLRLLQEVLDPLQQLVGDGCHLTRETAIELPWGHSGL
ncbi:hypothetical protein Taro_013240 [Colocasia esculenta]|uniref:Uncharacterized protein n=1 Tax=Colocasia esculenta TaxID=4460 RepID=A0A843UI58_COLES|nr:hypothetical protein [Colocasia esculenta]